MKKFIMSGAVALLVALVSQQGAFGQTLIDIGAVAPTNPAITYSQPQHESAGGSGVLNATSGVGEEFTLSGSDPTLQLTDIYVKASGAANGGAGAVSPSINWTLNLYNLTTSNEITQSISSVSVTAGDYLDFTLSSSASAQAQLVGGDTYAFSITTNSTYYIAGIYQNNESPSTPPSGITSENAITGNGAGNTLTTYSDSNGKADVTYFIQTVPEPPTLVLVLFGGLLFLVLSHFLNRKIA